VRPNCIVELTFKTTILLLRLFSNYQTGTGGLQMQGHCSDTTPSPNSTKSISKTYIQNLVYPCIGKHIGYVWYSSTSIPQVPYGQIYLICHRRSPLADRAITAAGKPRDLRHHRTIFPLPPDSPAIWPDKPPDNLSDMSFSLASSFPTSQTDT
jgi:hypothetical protein